MTDSRDRTGLPRPAELASFRTLLDDTDWASLATVNGTAEALPAALARLTDPDPAVRESAVQDALGPVTHQNTVYEAGVPVALCVAAVLDHPVLAAGGSVHDAGTPRSRPTLVHLLDWLGDTARDADDECLAVSERHWGPGFLDEYAEMRAFRDARPAIFSAVRALLDHEDADVRHAALVAAVPLVEHPLLTACRDDLAGHARRLLATSTDRYHRDRVLEALEAWGHDTGGLENAADVEARERHALLRAARASREGDRTGSGYSEEPPF